MTTFGTGHFGSGTFGDPTTAAVPPQPAQKAATHPHAPTQTTELGRTLTSAFLHDGRIYFGYGNTFVQDGVLQLYRLDPATLTWDRAPGHTDLPTLRVDNFRKIGTDLWVPFDDLTGTVAAYHRLSDGTGYRDIAGFNHNLLTANQGSIETDASGWEPVFFSNVADDGSPLPSTNNATLARSTAHALVGVASLQITRNVGAGTGRAGARTTGRVPVKGGHIYRGKASIRYPGAVTTGVEVTARLVWWDAAGNRVFTDPAFPNEHTATIASGSGWFGATPQTVSPPTATEAALQVEARNLAEGDSIFVDRCQIGEGLFATWLEGGGAPIRTNVVPVHVYDFVERVAGEQYVVGSFNAWAGAALLRFNAANNVWNPIITPASTTPTAASRFYFAGVLNGVIYTVMGDSNGQTGAAERYVYDIGEPCYTWDGIKEGRGPILDGFIKPVNHGNKLVYRSMSGQLLAFDGTVVTTVRPGPGHIAHAVSGDRLYVIDADRRVAWSTDLISWTVVGIAPDGAASLAIVDQVPYYGMKDSTVWRGTDPVPVETAPAPEPEPEPVFGGWPELADYQERALPSLRIEIEDRNPSNIWTNPPKWRRIDHTNHVREIHIRRIGAPNIWTPPEPSEMTLTLDNRNGYLDPSFPGSPYQALLTRDRQMRVLYTQNQLRPSESRFTRNTSGWAAGADTSLAIGRLGVVYGEQSMKVTYGGAAGGTAQVTLKDTKSVIVGRIYNLTAFLTPASTAAVGRVVIEWLDAAGAILSTTVGPSFNNTGQVEAVAGGTAPANAVRARLRVELLNLPTGAVHFVDGVTFGRTFSVFHCLVEKWPVRWTQKVGGDSTTDLVCYDRLGALGRAKLPPSLVEYELARGVKYPKPTHMYAFREQRLGPDVVFQDAIADMEGDPNQMPKAVSERLLPYGSPGGTEGAPAKAGLGNIDFGPYVKFPRAVIHAGGLRNNTFSVLCVARSERGFIPMGDRGLGSPGLQIAVMNVGYASKNETLRLAIRNASTGRTEYLIGPDRDLGDGNPHALWLVYEGAGTKRLYGHYDKTAIGNIYVPNVNNLVDINGGTANMVNVGVGGGQVGLFVTWERNITDGWKAAIWDDIFRPWAGDGSEARISKLLGVVAPGVPFQQGPSSRGTLLPVTFAERSPLTVVGNLMVDHADRFFANRFGTLTVITADNVPAVTRRYGEGGTRTHDIKVHEQDEAYGSVYYRNEAGSEVVVGDVTNGAQLAFNDSAVRASGLLRSCAQRLLDASAKTSKPAVSSIVLKPMKEAVSYENTLTLDLYDRIEVGYRRPWDNVLVVEKREICGLDIDGWTDDFKVTVWCRTPID